jgi:hypothetical protein
MENSNHESTNIALPKDKQAIQQAITNIYVGLDKANAKGVFTLKEAGQISRDLDTIAYVLDQVLKVYDNKTNL